METQLVNLTPHAVNIVSAEGDTIAVIPPSGDELRVEMERYKVGEVQISGASVPVYHSVPVGITSHWPGEVSGTKYIVSRMTAEAIAPTERTDILIPDDTVRDPNGRIIGCRAFATLVPELD